MRIFLSSLQSYILRYKWWFLGGLSCTIAADFFAVLGPQATGLVIDTISSATSLRYSSPPIQLLRDYLQHHEYTRQIVLASLAILVLAIVRGWFMYLMRQTLIVVSRKIEYDIKNTIYRKYQELDNSFYDKARTGDLMNRITEDVARIRTCAGPALMYLANILVLLSFSLYFMWRSSAVLTIVSLMPFPVFVYFTLQLNRRIYKCSHIVQEELSNLTSVANESFRGIKILQSFVQEERYKQLFRRSSERYKQGMLLLNKVEAFHFSGISLLIYASILIATGLGGYMALKQQISLAVVVEFILYINLLTSPCTLIGYIVSMLQKAIVSQQRVNDFLQTESRIKQISQPYVLSTPIRGQLDLRHISFAYQGYAPLFKDFSLHIGAGEKLAIMGEIGSGKSTLVKLLLRLYELDRGSICLDGIPITQFSLADLRAQYAYAPQESLLFSQSILENLLLGQNPLQEPSPAIIQACKDAQIYAEITQGPQGWHSLLGEQGISLSGGQKQRISIARALLKPETKVVILDDTLSAVDLESSQQILRNIVARLAHRTLIHITHRMLSPINYDRIIVLKQGQIIQSGTHAELLADRNGWYAHSLAKQQSPTLS